MKVKQTQAFVFVLLCAQNSEALELTKLKQKGHSKHSSKEFVEIENLGSNMSSLSLNMLNKSEQQESVPSDNVMVQTSTNLWSKIENAAFSQSSSAFSNYIQSLNREEIKDHTYLQVKGDDLNDSDIMAYSAVNAGADDDDDSAFSSGGAIMDALNKKDNSSEDYSKKKEIKPKTTKKVAKKTALKKNSDVQTDTDELNNDTQQQAHDSHREQFIDGVLGSNLSEDKYQRLKNKEKKKKLNSYEQQLEDEKNMWSSVSQSQIQNALDEEDPEQQEIKLAKKAEKKKKAADKKKAAAAAKKKAKKTTPKKVQKKKEKEYDFVEDTVSATFDDEEVKPVEKKKVLKKAPAKKSVSHKKVAAKKKSAPKKKEKTDDESADSTVSYYQQKQLDKLNSLSEEEINELMQPESKKPEAKKVVKVVKQNKIELNQNSQGDEDLLQPEAEQTSPANLGILDYSAQPLIEDETKEVSVIKTKTSNKKLSFADKAKEAEKKAIQSKKDNNMGFNEGLLDQKTGGAASISKIIQNVQKNKIQRKQEQSKVNDVDYTADLQQKEDNMGGEVKEIKESEVVSKTPEAKDLEEKQSQLTDSIDQTQKAIDSKKKEVQKTESSIKAKIIQKAMEVKAEADSQVKADKEKEAKEKVIQKAKELKKIEVSKKDINITVSIETKKPEVQPKKDDKPKILGNKTADVKNETCDTKKLEKNSTKETKKDEPKKNETKPIAQVEVKKEVTKPSTNVKTLVLKKVDMKAIEIKKDPVAQKTTPPILTEKSNKTSSSTNSTNSTVIDTPKTETIKNSSTQQNKQENQTSAAPKVEQNKTEIIQVKTPEKHEIKSNESLAQVQQEQKFEVKKEDINITVSIVNKTIQVQPKKEDKPNKIEVVKDKKIENKKAAPKVSSKKQKTTKKTAVKKSKTKKKAPKKKVLKKKVIKLNSEEEEEKKSQNEVSMIMDEVQNDESLPSDSEGFIGKHMKKLADKQKKLMEEKLAADEEEMLKSGIDIKPKYTKLHPKKKDVKRGILARAEEKMNQEKQINSDELADEALNDPNFNQELQEIQKELSENKKKKTVKKLSKKKTKQALDEQVVEALLNPV